MGFFSEEKAPEVLLTTTPIVSGLKINKYMGVITQEIVIGTVIVSEFAGKVTDMFGARGGRFESKLDKARKQAFEEFSFKVSDLGGNGAIGIDIDYVTFENNRAGLIVSGTVISGEWEEESLA
jgi:uncharacterized protein YbjQ (UPF0145 family)